MIESWLETKNVLLFNLDNVGQGHKLQKSLYLSNYTNDFYHIFLEVKAQSSALSINYIIFYWIIYSAVAGSRSHF